MGTVCSNTYRRADGCSLITDGWGEGVTESERHREREKRERGVS